MTQLVSDAARAIEPLEPDLWFERYQVIGTCAQAASGHAVEPSLRHLFHLAQLTPAPLVHLFGAEVCEASFEQLLEREQFDCAALLVLGRGVSFAISRSIDGLNVSAVISLSDGRHATKATAATLCQAILLAYCACIGSLRERTSRPLRSTGQARRTGRSVPHRLSTTH